MICLTTLENKTIQFRLTTFVRDSFFQNHLWITMLVFVKHHIRRHLKYFFTLLHLLNVRQVPYEGFCNYVTVAVCPRCLLWRVVFSWRGGDAHTRLTDGPVEPPPLRHLQLGGRSILQREQMSHLELRLSQSDGLLKQLKRPP